jgi:uncharacterized membrane protein
LLAAADLKAEQAAPPPPSWQYTASTATGVLTALIGAMVGLFGFVVTISVLVVQMATGTLSPRFMRLWYRDRLQKLVLAFFLGTAAFAFRLMREISTDYVPSIGVTLSGLLFGTSLILLLLYLDRFAHNLRPVGVGALVAAAGLREAQRAPARARGFAGVDHRPAYPRPPVAAIAQPRGGGAIQAINLRGLAVLAQRHDCVLELRVMVGDFITAGTVVVEVHGDKAPPAVDVLSMIALGNESSIEDDPGFAMRILVDIAIRAFSSAINDPTTGVQLINQIEKMLHGLLPYLTETPYRVVADTSGRDRLVFGVRTFSDVLQLAITEIREYGSRSIQVCRRLTAVLADLAERCPPEHRSAVQAEQAKLTRAIAEHFGDGPDRVAAETPDRQGIGAALT